MPKKEFDESQYVGDNDPFDHPDRKTVELSESDFWPGGKSPEVQRDVLREFLKDLGPFMIFLQPQMRPRPEPTIRFMETAAFAIPEVSVFISAGIGLAWSGVHPGQSQLYHEPLKSIISKTVRDELAKHELAEARRSIDQFNDHFKLALTMALPHAEGDLKHCKKQAEEFGTYCGPDGLLERAVHQIKDNLEWFHEPSHTVLIAAMQTYLLAQRVRLMCWQSVAKFLRDEDRIDEYNEALYEVMVVFKEVPESLDRLMDRVRDRIADTKRERIASCSTKILQTEKANDIVDQRMHSGDTFNVSGCVHDPKSDRDLLVAHLKERSTGRAVLDFFIGIEPFIPDGNGRMMKDDGSHDDEWLNRILAGLLETYKTRLLPPHLDAPFKELLDALAKVVGEARTFDKACVATAPQNPPHVIITGPAASAVPAPVDLAKFLKSSGEAPKKVSFRFSLAPAAGSGKTAFEYWSPWSEFVEYHLGEDGKVPRLHIGDGYAPFDTRRVVYARVEPSDEHGTRVGEVQGHGVLAWPNTGKKTGGHVLVPVAMK